MQTQIGIKCISKTAAEDMGQALILAYGSLEGTAKLARAGETKLLGISALNGAFNSPTDNSGLKAGMVVDAIVDGIAVCIFGSDTPEYGDPVKPDSQGRAVLAEAGDTAIGICDSPAGEGLYGRVKIQIHSIPETT